MPIKVSKIEVWSGEISDEVGGLDRVLGPLADAGAELECVIARRQIDKPGTGVVHATPIKGRKVIAAAKVAGLSPTPDAVTFRLEGPDKPGLGHRITQAIADAGLNMRGLSAMVIGRKFIAYIAFDSADDAGNAHRVLRALK